MTTVYDKAFRRHARKLLTSDQYAQVHGKAFHAAGGMTPRKPRMVDSPGGKELLEILQSVGRAEELRKERSKAVYDLVRSLAATPPPATEPRSRWEDAIIRSALIPPKRMLRLQAIAQEMEHLPTPKRPLEDISKSFDSSRPIIDPTKNKHIIYSVVLEPNTVDAHSDVMRPEDIEETAHDFMRNGQVIGSMHNERINAYCVESFIAPQDLTFPDGMYGPQTVTKGSWVIGIKILDDAEWQKVVDGVYTGVSIGGFGVREDIPGNNL